MLMTHLYWGDPNEEFSFDLAKTLVRSGADILEIGIPYTDPVCDGEVFQRACRRALDGGMTPPKVFEGIQKLRDEGIKNPIYLTSYYGPVYKMGVETFVMRARESGVQGLIIPDILLEEQGELQAAAKMHGLAIIQFATIYSSHERLKKICEASTDFIYCMSLAGVTGDHSSLRPGKDTLGGLITKIKKFTDKKIFVGFGISSVEAVNKILSLGADGIIVGSAITKYYEPFVDTNVYNALKAVGSFVQSLKS